MRDEASLGAARLRRPQAGSALGRGGDRRSIPRRIPAHAPRYNATNGGGNRIVPIAGIPRDPALPLQSGAGHSISRAGTLPEDACAGILTSLTIARWT